MPPQQFDPSKPFEVVGGFDPSKPFTMAPAVTEAHPEAKMSAAAPGGGVAFAGDDGVTLGDLLHDPVDAMQKIGAAVKRDVTDPKLWASIALGYFGPKAADVVVPAVANAARATMRGGMAAAKSSPELVGIVSPRIGNAMKVARNVGQAVMQGEAPTEAPPVQPQPPPAAPAETPRELTARVRAEYRAANGGAVQPVAPVRVAPAAAEAPPATAPVAATAAAVPEAPQTAPAAAQAAPVAKNPAIALKQAKDIFATASEAARPGELNRAMNFILWGKSPEDALAAVLQQRGGATAVMDPAAELLKRGIGISDDAAAEMIRKRGYKR